MHQSAGGVRSSKAAVSRGRRRAGGKEGAWRKDEGGEGVGWKPKELRLEKAAREGERESAVY